MFSNLELINFKILQHTNTSEKTTSKALYIPKEVLLLLRRKEKRTT